MSCRTFFLLSYKYEMNTQRNMLVVNSLILYCHSLFYYTITITLKSKVATLTFHIVSYYFVFEVEAL